MHAQFEIVKHESGKYIFIRDIGECVRSVTNDAEYVIKLLYMETPEKYFEWWLKG